MNVRMSMTNMKDLTEANYCGILPVHNMLDCWGGHESCLFLMQLTPLATFLCSSAAISCATCTVA